MRMKPKKGYFSCIIQTFLVINVDHLKLYDP